MRQVRKESPGGSLITVEEQLEDAIEIITEARDQCNSEWAGLPSEEKRSPPVKPTSMKRL